jgi:hypothetical protein
MRREWLLAVGILGLAIGCSLQEHHNPVGSDPAVGTSGGGSVRALAVNCTFTLGFWKNHASAWPVTSLTLGAATFTEDQAIDLLRTPPRGGDASIILAHQLIAAKLNLAQGADGSSVAMTIADADALLTAHPVGSKPGGADRDQMVALSSTLDDFNSGKIGPGHCGEPGPSPSPSPSPEPSPSPSSTPDPGK